MRPLLLLIRVVSATILSLLLLGAIGLGGAYYYFAPQLPSIEVLRDVRLQVPLRVYSRDGLLMAEFGEMKRTPVSYDQVPPRLIEALLSAEDDRFFSHPGVDYQGMMRAVLNLIRTGERSQGASTITMQVARNFFLTSERTYKRKLIEVLLALKIERELSKQEILELYLNKIYLGNRAYGVAEAARVYYGKELGELDLAEIAMLAGLPKAPSTINPVVNPDRAGARRNYVLGRMRELGFINDEEFKTASAAPVATQVHYTPIEVEAPYVAEMVRAEMLSRFGDETYSHGYNVYTTINPRLQRAANRAVRGGLLDYDRRHGYRGPEEHWDLAELDEPELRRRLDKRGTVGELLPAVVTRVDEQAIEALLPGDRRLEIEWKGLSWARKYINTLSSGPTPKRASDILAVGDVIRLEAPRSEEDIWKLAEVPAVSSALVSLNPNDGAIHALVGGFDYYQSKFNRATQAERQPGSNFKPFIYSAALAHGFTPASLINDAPVVYEIPGSEPWRPENYNGRFYGPTRLREALTHSRNLVSIRLLQAVGVETAIDHVIKFGFDRSKLAPNLSLALGTADVTPLELVRGYAVLANGGYHVDPYFIERITDIDGNDIDEAHPLTVCEACETDPATPTDQPQPLPVAQTTPANVGDKPAPPPAPRVVDARNIYMMNSIMQDVITYGTGQRAKSLGRSDLAGKTGTTNDQKDAWFSGFNRDLVTTVWVGFDNPVTLGSKETGARAALPIWIDYMGVALDGVPESTLAEPPGLLRVRVDKESGLRTSADNPNAMFEIFAEENLPEQEAPYYASGPAIDIGGGDPNQTVIEQLF